MRAVSTKLFTGILVFGLLLTGRVQAFDEGIDFFALSQPQPTESGDKIEVLELFWYGCPHCYHLEPVLQQWQERKPGNVAFRRMPAVLGPSWGIHAHAFYALQVLGEQERLHLPLFRAMHEQHKRLRTAEDLAGWVATQGVDREAFLKAFNSFVVDLKVRRAGQLTRRFGIDGVPTVVVNGKYVTSPSITGSSGRMIEVIDFLTAVEAGEVPLVADEPESDEPVGGEAEADESGTDGAAGETAAAEPDAAAGPGAPPQD